METLKPKCKRGVPLRPAIIFQIQVVIAKISFRNKLDTLIGTRKYLFNSLDMLLITTLSLAVVQDAAFTNYLRVT